MVFEKASMVFEKLTGLELVLRGYATELRDRLGADESGQTAAEYLGIIVVVAAIIVAIAGMGIGEQVGSNILSKVGEIFGA